MRLHINCIRRNQHGQQPCDVHANSWRRCAPAMVWEYFMTCRMRLPCTQMNKKQRQRRSADTTTTSEVRERRSAHTPGTRHTPLTRRAAVLTGASEPASSQASQASQTSSQLISTSAVWIAVVVRRGTAINITLCSDQQRVRVRRIITPLWGMHDTDDDDGDVHACICVAGVCPDARAPGHSCKSARNLR